MDPVNLACFSQPEWRVIANGMDTEKWFNEGVGQGTGGITMPIPVNLPIGQKYYRFASSTSSEALNLAEDGGLILRTTELSSITLIYMICNWIMQLVSCWHCRSTGRVLT